MPINWSDLSCVTVPEGRCLPGTAIEIIRPVAGHPAFKAAFFDLDGTLSLIRSGWMEVMVPMMVEELRKTGTDEPVEALSRLVREMVYRLTGRQTIYQMMALADEVRRRGGRPLDPLEYKRAYLERLMGRIAGRLEGLRSGAIPPKDLLVPGAQAMLALLRDRGLPLVCASGTDEADCLEEVELLGLAEFFDGRVYGARDDYRASSKRAVIRQMCEEWDLGRGELLGVGDGFVEMEEVKAAGGVAVGAATEEPECRRVDQWKRKRLILAGADLIVPNFLEHQALLGYLLEGSQ